MIDIYPPEISGNVTATPREISSQLACGGNCQNPSFIVGT
jgi:hypothetical protein